MIVQQSPVVEIRDQFLPQKTVRTDPGFLTLPSVEFFSPSSVITFNSSMAVFI